MRAFFVVLILAWLTGIVLGVVGVSVVVVALVAGAFCLAAGRQVRQLIVAVMLLVCLGYVWGGYVGTSKIADCDFESKMTGKVIGQPIIEAERILVVIQDERECRALVTMGRFNELEEGDVIELTGGQVQTLDEVRDYSIGYAGYLERRGISATWRYPAFVKASAGKSPWTNKLHEEVRRWVTSLFIEPDASVVLAVLLAEKGTLPEELVDQFRATGVSHVLAISGLHISLLTGMLLAVLIMLPLAPRVRLVATLVWLWSYVVFIGLPTSAVRAAAFWTIALLAWQLHALVSLPTILLLAAVALVSLDPLFIADVGFQLSISAVMGIFVMLFLMRNPLQLPLIRGSVHNLVPAWATSLILVSLGAWLGTLPVIVYHFNNIVLSGVVTNLLVVPLVPAMLMLAIVALLTSLIFMPAAMLVAWLMHGVIRWIDFVTGFISSVPGLFYEGVSVPMWLVFVYYLIMAGLSGVILWYQKRNWREIWQ